MPPVRPEACPSERADAALRESEERFRSIVETANEGIWTLDANARITFVNRRLAEMLGYSIEEMLGRAKWDFVLPEDQDRMRAAFERRRRGVREQLDVGFRRRNGVTLWALMAAQPLLDESGRFRGSLDMFTDVTQRRRAEQAVHSLLHAGQKLNSTLELDALLRTLAEEAASLMFAEGAFSGLRTPKGLRSGSYFREGRFVPFEYCWPAGTGLSGSVLAEGAPYFTNDAAADPRMVEDLVERFGIRRALAVPILDAHGEVLGSVGVHDKKDGTEFTDADTEPLLALAQVAAVAIQNALAYRRVRDAERSLKEADRRKDEFLATLAHELRNPLAPIRSAVEVLRLSAPADSGIDAARRVLERQVAQMVRLVDDLLDLSRISGGKLRLRKERIAISAVVDSAVETARPVLQAAGHTLEVRLPAEPVHLDADLTRLAQVVANLLNNAAKYTERGGRILLSAAAEDGQVVLRVRDSGIGLSPEHLARIFDMFAQVTPSLERSQGGLGIGLALARSLVDMHGGRIEARSDGPGRGSEFVVRLPAAAQQPLIAGGGGPQPRAAASSSRRRVLVVDDNRDAADTMAMLLSALGHEARAIYDGAEAVQAGAAFRPDVIFLDIGLPRLSGYEVARRVREAPWGRDVRLVALTGWGRDSERRRALEAGFDLHLTKPIDPASLPSIIAPAETKQDA